MTDITTPAFDPNRPFRTRNGGKVDCLLKIEFNNKSWWHGTINGLPYSWWPSGKNMGGFQGSFDLVNFDPTPVATVPSGADARVAELRAEGWMVAVHNDYRVDGEARTFWLLTHPSGRWIKGEGRTDAEALAEAALAGRPRS